MGSVSEEPALSLHTDAVTALSAVQRALSKLLASFPERIRRPTDLQHVLKLDYKLCWQIFNITRAESPLSISHYVPGSASTKKFLTAAGTRGVPGDVIAEVDRAMSDFQEVVAAHANDRQGFDSMLASLSGGNAAETLTMQHRRSAFRNESQIWGVQVETYMRQMIVRRAAEGDKLETCFVNCKYGMRQLRREVMPIVHGYRELSSSVSPADHVHPLEPAATEKYGAPVVEEFCTRPVPKFMTVLHSDGWLYSALDSDQIGRKSTVNLVFSGLARDVTPELDEQGKPELRCGAAFIAPTELGIIELMVHRPSLGAVVPRFQVYATAAGSDVPEIMRRTPQFLIHEKLMAMGNAAEVQAVLEVPQYAAQQAHVFGCLGWNMTEFDLYRVRLQYPILHTAAQIFGAVG